MQRSSRSRICSSGRYVSDERLRYSAATRVSPHPARPPRPAVGPPGPGDAEPQHQARRVDRT
ncbi:hypothetical protein C0056_34835, partial [Pseudomonas aeruginosa]